MSLQLVVSNPPRKRRKTTKKKTRRRVARRKPVARRKTTRRRASIRRSPARRRRRSSSGSMKLLSMGTVKLAAFSTGGFLAASILPDKLGIEQLQTGYGRVAGKVLVGIAGGMVLGKAIGKSGAAAFTTGALTAAGVDLYGQIRAGSLSGMGQIDPFFGETDGPPLLGMDGLAGNLLDDDELAGMGVFEEEESELF